MSAAPASAQPNDAPSSGTPTTLTSSCHCGAVKITFDTPTEPLNECHCRICRRYGALWAYSDPALVTITGPKTDTYRYGNMTHDFHRCPGCGCVTHWADFEGEEKTPPKMGINCNMLEKDVLARLDREVDEDGPPLEDKSA